MPITSEILKKYLNPVFIETGSGLGDGIQAALDAGFECICSIELDFETYYDCLLRFEGNYKLNFYNEDTTIGIKEALDDWVEDQQCTFWLDAHNENDYPVLAELESIKQHPIKTHTILIDDLRMFHTDKNGLTVEQIKAKILEINPNYKFSFENGHVKNDILVAKV